MKKKLSVICSAIILCLACIFALAACGGGVDDGGGGGGGGTNTNAADFNYVSTNTGVMISSYKGFDKVVGLPEKTQDGSPVVGILYELEADNSIKAPFENSNVEEINIPANITYLGNGDNLKNEEMIRSVFFGAKNLKKITVAQDNSAYSSQNGVLYNKNLTTLIACPAVIDTLSVPEGVKKIAPAAFKYDYTLGNGVETAFNSTFENFGTFSSNFTTVELPSTLSSFCFEGCRKLTSVDLSRCAVTKLDCGAFRQCFALKSVKLPDSLQTIGSGAFQNSGIESITIPQNVRAINVIPAQDGSGDTKSLAEDVFSFCENLTSVTAPAQVLFGEKTRDVELAGTTFAINSATNQFLGCDVLREITVNGANPGMGGKAFAVTDFTYGSAWCNSVDAANHTFRALQKITYLNGCFAQLNANEFDAFLNKYSNVDIIK